MRVLALDAALDRYSVALLEDGTVLAEYAVVGPRQAATLPGMVEAAFRQADGVDLVAVTVGPGSFTGIRASLSIGHGIAAACGCAIVGVTVREALAVVPSSATDRSLWVAITAGRGRAFLDSGADIRVIQLDDPPRPDGKIALSGDAAAAVAARLAARGHDVMLAEERFPRARHVALAGQQRHAGVLPPRSAQPLYIDPPLAQARPGRPPPAAIIA